MLKTFFGCCPLRNGVSVIAIVNMVSHLNIYNIIKIKQSLDCPK